MFIIIPFKYRYLRKIKLDLLYTKFKWGKIEEIKENQALPH